MISRSAILGILVPLFAAHSAGCGESIEVPINPARDASVVVTDDAALPDHKDAAAMLDSCVAPKPDAGVDAAASDSGVADAADADVQEVGVLDASAADVGLVDGGPSASNLTVVINRDVDPAPTPINDLYVSEIDSTASGDSIISYQKYFRNEAIIAALMDAARRGVQVTGIYRDDVTPSCESLRVSGDTIDCGSLFVSSAHAHHKNMMILHADGTAHAVIGSYNPRIRSASNPRVHTVLSFEVAQGQALFGYYAAEVDRLSDVSTTAPLTHIMPIDGGGELQLTFHPGPANPVLDLLNGINSCDETLWLSYFGAFADSIGAPVFDRLETMVQGGCDVRVLLDESNTLARLSLLGRGVPVRFPTFATPSGTLGHKIVFVESNQEMHLIQSSANLESAHHNINHNLTVYVRAPASSFSTGIDTELLRYW